MVDPFQGVPDPHLDPQRFDALIEAVGPDACMVVVKRWMGEALQRQLTPEDVWQETLLHAWRDREKHAWNGLATYRSWLLSVAKNRIHDLADQATAQKRGSGKIATEFSALVASQSFGISGLLPGRSTTPSVVASYAERAQRMELALSRLPTEQEAVVRLHLFEELPMSAVAAQLEVPEATAWYRFRRGAQQNARELESVNASRRGPPPA